MISRLTVSEVEQHIEIVRQPRMDRWEGRVAVVTGGSEGIGEAIVRRLAASGMKVVALARRQHLLEKLEREISTSGGRGEVKGYVCDVTAEADVARVFSKIEAEVGPVAVLVNNAGVLRTVTLTNMNMGHVHDLVNTNILGVAYCTTAALASMKRNKVNDGHIITVSSMAAHLDMSEHPDYAMYAVSKTAVSKLTKSIKLQLAKDKSKIRVSTLCPGLVDTSMTKPVIAAIAEMSQVPHLTSDDIADNVQYFLAAPPHVNITELQVEPI